MFHGTTGVVGFPVESLVRSSAPMHLPADFQVSVGRQFSYDVENFFSGDHRPAES